MMFPSVDVMLRAHGLAGALEKPLVHNGYSGAIITSLVRGDGARFVLKRMAIERDWLMRALDDVDCREAQFAAAGIELGDGVAAPYVGAAREGDGHAVLMRDIGAAMIPHAPISERQLDVILRGMAALHRVAVPAADLVPWCDVGKRVSLLTPQTAAIAVEYQGRIAPDLIAGWPLFEKHASPRAVEIIRALWEDDSTLVAALGEMPASLLHGDMKLDNVGIDDDGVVWLVDWAMVMVGAAGGRARVVPAHELARDAGVARRSDAAIRGGGVDAVGASGATRRTRGADRVVAAGVAEGVGCGGGGADGVAMVVRAGGGGGVGGRVVGQMLEVGQGGTGSITLRVA